MSSLNQTKKSNNHNSFTTPQESTIPLILTPKKMRTYEQSEPQTTTPLYSQKCISMITMSHTDISDICKKLDF